MSCRLCWREPLRLLRSSSHINHHLLPHRRAFRAVCKSQAIRPYMLADIGEGITECQIVSWSVKPGDQVQQFDTICEVSSDKATVEITSRFDGTIKALHYEENDMAIVGKPLIDIDIVDNDLEAEQVPTSGGDQVNTTESIDDAENSIKPDIQRSQQSMSASKKDAEEQQPKTMPTADMSSIATPAVRHLLKKHNLSIANITGSGKGGRVLKEDVERIVSKPRNHSAARISIDLPETPTPRLATTTATEEDRTVRLSPVENQMFKVMTRSLSIPHVQYTHSVDLTNFINSSTRFPGIHASSIGGIVEQGSSLILKLTPFPYIMKALSQVFTRFPKLNSHLDLTTNPNHPMLTFKASHDFGIAVDSPQGLLVPVIRQVQKYSVIELAAEIKRVSTMAREGQLKPEDFQNATFTISNIGSVGACGALGPIIVEPMVGILGIGRILDVPAFSMDKISGVEQIVKEKRAVLSWSADHRIIDGATVARAAEMLASLLKFPDTLGLTLR